MPVKKLSDLPQKISSDNGDGFVITSVTGQDMRVPFQNLRENLGVDELEDKASLSSVSSIANLKTFNTSPLKDGDTVNVLGYYESGDGGGGKFYWDADSEEVDNGGTVIQVTGVTTGRFKRPISDYVDTLWFGLKQEESFDNGDAVYNAVAEAGRIGIKNIRTPAGVCGVLSTKINNLSDVGDNINIGCVDGVSVFDVGSDYTAYTFLLGNKDEIDLSALITENISEGDTHITTDTPIDFYIGQYIYLDDPTSETQYGNSGSPYLNGDQNEVVLIDGSTVYFKYPFVKSHTIANTSFREISLYEKPRIHDITLKLGNNDLWGFRFHGREARIENITLQGFGDNDFGIVSTNGINTKIEDCTVSGFLSTNNSGGYAVWVGGLGCKVRNNNLSTSRHPISTSSKNNIAKGLEWSGNHFYGNRETTGKTQVVDIHDNVYDVTIRDNHFYGIGLNLRCDRFTVKNNKYYGCKLPAFQAWSENGVYLSDVTFSSNEFYYPQGDGNVVRFASPLLNSTINDNKIYHYGTESVNGINTYGRQDGDSLSIILDRVKIYDNDIHVNGTALIQGEAKNTKIYNNNLVSDSGITLEIIGSQASTEIEDFIIEDNYLISELVPIYFNTGLNIVSAYILNNKWKSENSFVTTNGAMDALYRKNNLELGVKTYEVFDRTFPTPDVDGLFSINMGVTDPDYVNVRVVRSSAAGTDIRILSIDGNTMNCKAIRDNGDPETNTLTIYWIAKK